MQAKEKKQFSNESSNHSNAEVAGPSGVGGGIPHAIAMSKSIQFTNLGGVLGHMQ